jgi:hypothetical protein
MPIRAVRLAVEPLTAAVPFGLGARAGARAGESEGLMFGWSYLDDAGEELGSSQRFPDAESAEEWMSDAWRDLVDNGVASVALHDHARGRRLYRMGLGSE